jgi:DNA-binding NarL/FixJ family response regulator
MSSPTIVVADDHPMLLKGLTEELRANNFNVIGTAIDGAKAFELITTQHPDIAIVDIEMPILSGFEVIKKCVEQGVITKFIILTSHKEKAFVIKAKKLNIHGYLLKDEPFQEIENCIDKVVSGETYFSKTFDHIFKTQVSPELQRIKFLSPSERTIVRMIAQEKSSKEISVSLSISIRTVQKHRANIIKKLALPSTLNALHQWSMENKELLFSI